MHLTSVFMTLKNIWKGIDNLCWLGVSFSCSAFWESFMGIIIKIWCLTILKVSLLQNSWWMIPAFSYTTDIRNGTCYQKFSQSSCVDPRTDQYGFELQITKATCCCSKGEGWQHTPAQRCELCPKPGDAGFSGLCPDGYGVIKLPDGSMKDINECMVSKECHGGICINTDRGFRCECPPGYMLDRAGTACIGKSGLLFHLLMQIVFDLNFNSLEYLFLRIG